MVYSANFKTIKFQEARRCERDLQQLCDEYLVVSSIAASSMSLHWNSYVSTYILIYQAKEERITMYCCNCSINLKCWEENNLFVFHHMFMYQHYTSIIR